MSISGSYSSPMTKKDHRQKVIPLSIRKAFADKSILLIGSTGFLGKVWLTMLLSQVPSIKKIYVLVRGKGGQTGQQRFEQLINSSPAFEHMHKQFRYELGDYLREKITIINGNINQSQFGLSESEATDLAKKVDLVVNFAGLVDFKPDLREAYEVNVLGAKNVADFTVHTKNKKLVHISTCYVAGTREGAVDEKVISNQTPSGKAFNIDYELNWIESTVKKIVGEHNSPEQVESARKMIQDRNIELNKKPFSESRLRKTIENMKRRKLRQALTDTGMERSISLGWTNTYTYSKALAEIVLKQQYSDLDLVIFRPSIVESAASFPFAGWNEGFNTSGPLAYLMKTWFRHLPLTKGNPFDVIPVDLVSRGLTIACAAALDETHVNVYHCSSSDRNRLTIDQACRYTSLSHSNWYRKNGIDWRERQILSRWRTIPSRKDHPLATHNLKRIFSTFQKMVGTLPSRKTWLKTTYNWILKINRRLEQTERLLELFYPFIHDYRHIFQTNSLFLYNVSEKEFQFSIEDIDWKQYWLNIQMPGLRRWCFPVIEGRTVEKTKNSSPFSFSTDSEEPNYPINETQKPAEKKFQLSSPDETMLLSLPEYKKRDLT